MKTLNGFTWLKINEDKQNVPRGTVVLLMDDISGKSTIGEFYPNSSWTHWQSSIHSVEFMDGTIFDEEYFS